MADYAAKSIKTLDYFEHIRQYPGMYIGSKDQKGLHHCLRKSYPTVWMNISMAAILTF